MRARAATALLSCALLGCAVRARGELVFRVPDVVVKHEAAPDRPVGTGVARNQLPDQQTGARASTAAPAAGRRCGADGGGGAVATTSAGGAYEEFEVEHAISTVDARAAVQQIDMARLQRRYGCGECTREELAYCEWQVVADHCCCELSYTEPYSWIPHTCYMGSENCRTIAKDCFVFRRLRDCCCDARLAEKWKSILASSTKLSAMRLVVLLGPTLALGALL